MLLRQILLTATLLIAGHAHALTPEEAKGMTFGETDARVEALNKAAANAPHAAQNRFSRRGSVAYGSSATLRATSVNSG